MTVGVDGPSAPARSAACQTGAARQRHDSRL